MPQNYILCFADWPAIISTGKTLHDVEIEMNNYLNDILIWLALNRLSLNIVKLVFMTLGNYSESDLKFPNILINRQKLKALNILELYLIVT